ncbi:MAG: transporter substrate-binding domain-containing protein [Thermodesulfovibrionales bacterium]|jgi:general L-amino acid transport system substrate-binding protein
MRLLSVLLVMFTVWCAISTAKAGSVIERVKARGVVRCGSAERPGLASADDHGRWTGLNVDVCRGIAAAVLRSADRIEYHQYETPKQFDAVRKQEDDVYFLTGSEINEQKLAGKVVPGPTVFVESHAVMVPSNSSARSVGDLAGNTICFMIGSSTERSINAYFDALHKNWLRMPYSEDGEMNDAYSVQHCHAIAGEITTLAATRLTRGVNRLSSRFLPEPLSVFPLMVATGTNDAQWSAIVVWTVDTLISAERPETHWYAGGAGAMPVAAQELGLDRGWQRRVLATVGNYGDIFERHLGKDSPLKLDCGLNANQFRGGLLLSPFLE